APTALSPGGAHPLEPDTVVAVPKAKSVVDTSSVGARSPAGGLSGPAPPPGAPRVLVVDDESNITELVGTALRYEGFAVDTAGSGHEAIQHAEKSKPALVLLDVMLPDEDGFAVLRRLRDRVGGVPVIFLTARDATADKVGGLKIGGDDYITKPFSLEELVARVRAVLRRAGVEPDGGRLVFADLELDEETHEVWRGGTPIELTATEFNLLRYLMQNPRRVLSRTQILESVWDIGWETSGNIVETYISYLRKKIDQGHPALIQTLRGAGYSLRELPGGGS
ncbi:MAG TPA: response regulator transcription factor, partial [Acidimicrobiales bacterium]|nr:response regulator transcription factor [Acidimicrobiales bacterium]